MPDTVDWSRISAQFSKRLHEVYANPGTVVDCYAEALRRTFGYVAADEPGTSGRALPYEHLSNGFGLTTQAQAKYETDTIAYFDRSNREKAEEQVKEVRAELSRVYREAGQDLADLLRAKCNERSVPSRYRREGVAWAADTIDPRVPKDQYGNLREQAPDGAR